MSSVLAHIAAGATVFACSGEGKARPSFPFLAACVLLAVLPDADYFLWWIFHINLEPRLTHSFVFSLAGSAVIWVGLRFFAFRPNLGTFVSLVASASSHLILDFLVGVHPLPLLWPFVDSGFAASPGVLPSAGQLRLLIPSCFQ